MSRPRLEVADILRLHGGEYRRKHGAALAPEQVRVLGAIERCRTGALGGHIHACDQCGHRVIAYNSCRNRHCPKCQSMATAQWREARRAELLPVEYYHVVFTLPDGLGPVALQNKAVVYDRLFQAVSQTLLRIGGDPKHLGAELGFLAILHTWGQNLMYHPHIHCVVPGGGLSRDSTEWISCRSGFLFSVRVLSRLFRRLFLDRLTQDFAAGRIRFHGTAAHLNEPTAFERLMQSCRKSEWVVYAKPPFAGPEKVLDYLARYTHRIAISNNRIVSLENGCVTFTWRDYSHNGTQGFLTLEAHEFIRRFLLHVLPDRFTRIRYYGFMAHCHRTPKLALCRRLLSARGSTDVPVPQKQDWAALLISLTGVDPLLCPKCHQGRLACIGTVEPVRLPPSHGPPGPPP